MEKADEVMNVKMPQTPGESREIMAASLAAYRKMFLFQRLVLCALGLARNCRMSNRAAGGHEPVFSGNTPWSCLPSLLEPVDALVQ